MFYSSVHAETHSVSPSLCHDVVIAAFRSKTMLNLLLGANRDTYPAARRSLAEQTRGDSTWLWLFDLSHRLTPSHTVSQHLNDVWQFCLQHIWLVTLAVLQTLNQEPGQTSWENAWFGPALKCHTLGCSHVSKRRVGRRWSRGWGLTLSITG